MRGHGRGKKSSRDEILGALVTGMLMVEGRCEGREGGTRKGREESLRHVLARSDRHFCSALMILEPFSWIPSRFELMQVDSFVL